MRCCVPELAVGPEPQQRTDRCPGSRTCAGCRGDRPHVLPTPRSTDRHLGVIVLPDGLVVAVAEAPVGASPQQRTAALSRIAQAWLRPTDSAVAGLARLSGGWLPGVSLSPTLFTGAAVAQLTGEVRAPAAHRAVIQESTGVLAGRHGARSSPRAEVDRSGAAGRLVVSDRIACCRNRAVQRHPIPSSAPSRCRGRHRCAPCRRPARLRSSRCRDRPGRRRPAARCRRCCRLLP